MATQMIPTASMNAYAEILLSRSDRWARGRRNRDGVQFVTFASSRRDKDGQPIYHQTAIDGSGCTCTGYLWRGICSHAIACRMDAERARERAACRPRYEDLYRGSGVELTDAF